MVVATFQKSRVSMGLHPRGPARQILEIVSPSAAQQCHEVFEYVLTYNSQWFEQARGHVPDLQQQRTKIGESGT